MTKRPGPRLLTDAPSASRCRDQTGCSRGEATDRWAASEGGVAAGSVVVLQPAVQGGGALIVAGPGGGVGPFGLQGAVEPLGLPVGPGPAGLDEPPADPELGAGGDPGVAAAIAEGVVGQHPADDHAVGGEPGRGAGQKAGAAGRALV